MRLFTRFSINSAFFELNYVCHAILRVAQMHCQLMTAWYHVNHIVRVVLTAEIIHTLLRLCRGTIMSYKFSNEREVAVL
jgi:hypothetical protein